MYCITFRSINLRNSYCIYFTIFSSVLSPLSFYKPGFLVGSFRPIRGERKNRGSEDPVVSSTKRSSNT